MKLLLFITTLFFTFQSFSQSKSYLTGIVKNGSGEAVSNASVYLYKDSSLSASQFIISRKDGIFKFSIVTATNLKLEVKCVGYKTHVIYITQRDFNDKDTIFQTIVLQKDDKLLEEVTIRVRLPIVENGDTTTFNVEKFKTTRQENIEDLIKDLPGFKVKENGQIFFKNKLITKTLIEGDDMFGDNYQQLTKNFSSDKVSQIQVIEHFTDSEDILSGLSQSNATVINIKFGSAKTKVNGTVSGAVGLPVQRTEEKINLLGIRPKAKTVLIGAYNTIGKTNTPLLAKTKYGNSLFNRRNLTSIQEISSNTISPDRSNDNRSFNSSFNFLLKPAPSVIIKSKLIWLKDNYTQAQEIISQFRNEVLPPFSIQEYNRLEKDSRSVLTEVEINYNRKNKFQLIYTPSFSSLRNNSHADGMLNDSLQSQLLKSSQKLWQHSLRLNYKFSTRLSARLDVNHGSSPGTGCFALTPGMFRSHFQLPDSVVQILQQMDNPLSGTSVNLQLLQKAKKSTTTFNTGVSNQRTDFISHLQGISYQGKAYHSSLFTSNYSLLSQQDYYIETKRRSWLKKGGSLDISVPLHYIKQSFTTSSSIYTNGYFTFTPEVKASFTVANNSKLLLGYKLMTEIGDIYSNLPDFFLADNRSLAKSSLSAFQASTHTFNTGFIYQNFQKRKLLSFFNVSYSVSAIKKIITSSIINFISLNSLQKYDYKNLGGFSTNYYLSKLFVRPKLQLEVNAITIFNQSPSIINNQVNVNRFSLLNTELLLKSLYSGVFNFSIANSITRTTNTQKNATSQPATTINSIMTINKLSFFIKMNAKLDLSSDHQIISASQYMKKATYLYLADIQFNYNIIPKKLMARLIIKNMLNEKKISFNEASPDNLFITSNAYYLIPRFALLKLEYKF